MSVSAIVGDEPNVLATFADALDGLGINIQSDAEAERLVNALREISDKPEIVVLRLSCYDDIAASVTLKDDRHARH